MKKEAKRGNGDRVVPDSTSLRGRPERTSAARRVLCLGWVRGGSTVNQDCATARPMT